jgi:hypothetical protein
MARKWGNPVITKHCKQYYQQFVMPTKNDAPAATATPKNSSNFISRASQECRAVAGVIDITDGSAQFQHVERKSGNGERCAGFHFPGLSKN